jgi:hypothetical protein
MNDELLMKMLKDVAETAYCNAKGYQYPSDITPTAPHDAFDKIKSRDQRIALAAQIEALEWVRDMLGISSHHAEGLIAYPRVLERIKTLKSKQEKRDTPND